MPYPRFAPIPPFLEFEPSTWVIPKLYWDAFSPEQRYHAICKQLGKIISYCSELGIKTDELGDLYNTLADDFEAFKEHGFDDYYRELIETWIDEHMEEIVSRACRMVYFGLTLDGYFKAVIPESWYDITFDTGMDYSLDTYGRLMLYMDVDSPHWIDQTPEERQG